MYCLIYNVLCICFTYPLYFDMIGKESLTNMFKQLVIIQIYNEEINITWVDSPSAFVIINR